MEIRSSQKGKRVERSGGGAGSEGQAGLQGLCKTIHRVGFSALQRLEAADRRKCDILPN